MAGDDADSDLETLHRKVAEQQRDMPSDFERREVRKFYNNMRDMLNSQ